MTEWELTPEIKQINPDDLIWHYTTSCMERFELGTKSKSAFIHEYGRSYTCWIQLYAARIIRWWHQISFEWKLLLMNESFSFS